MDTPGGLDPGGAATSATLATSATSDCYNMEVRFDEVDQRRELVMNVTDYNNVRLWIFIVDNDNLSSKEETYIQQFLF